VTGIFDEVARAIQALGLSTQACRMLSGVEGRAVFQAVEARCVTRRGLRWWWEALTEPNASHSFVDRNGAARLHEIAPDPTERVWFIADADEDDYIVYDTSVRDAERVIGECFAFEYVLASKDGAWAIGENHHHLLWAVGARVVPRLIEAAQPSPDGY
jgi:hypothetical protein